MVQTLEGVVLGVLKILGGRQIVTVYTREQGRLSFVFRTPRTRKSAVTVALLQPLAVVQVTADIKPNASLHHLSAVGCVFPYGSITLNPYKSTMVLFLQEFLYHAVREEGMPNKPLYDFIVTSLKWLDAVGEGYANFHIAFLLRISAFLGLQPNTEHYVSGAYFDLQNACFTVTRPITHPYYLPPGESAAVCQLMRMDLWNMGHFRLNRAQRGRILSVLNDYYRLHIPDFPELKSLQVLKEVFGS